MTQGSWKEEHAMMCFMSKTQNMNQVHAFSTWRETEDNSLNNSKDNRLECNIGLRLQASLWVYI